jgi:hypothetical protein
VQGLQKLVNLSGMEKEKLGVSAKYEADRLEEVGPKDIVVNRVVREPYRSTRLSECSDQYLPIGGSIPDLYRPPVYVILG